MKPFLAAINSKLNDEIDDLNNQLHPTSSASSSTTESTTKSSSGGNEVISTETNTTIPDGSGRRLKRSIFRGRS